MHLCPNCKSKVKQDYLFCPNCAQSLKCPNCGKDIEGVYEFCAYCGKNLLSQDRNHTSNEYSFLEERDGDKYKRSVNLKASNDAIENLAELLISNSKPILRATIPHNETEISAEANSQQENLLVSSLNDDNGEIVPRESILENTAPIEPYEKIRDYIFPLDDELQVKLDNFEGNSKVENQRRLILLFVGGFQYYFQPQVPTRSQIIGCAKSLDLWTSKFSNVITNLARKHLIEKDEGLRLSPLGKQEVEKIIEEIVNPTKEMTMNSSRSRKSNSTKLKIGAEKEQKLNEWINSLGEWKDFDVRELEGYKNRQKLQFGLWVLKRTSNVTNVALLLLIEFIIRAYPTIGTNKDALRKSANSKKHFGKTQDGEIFLTKDGEADIENILPDSLKGSE